MKSVKVGAAVLTAASLLSGVSLAQETTDGGVVSNAEWGVSFSAPNYRSWQEHESRNQPNFVAAGAWQTVDCGFNLSMYAILVAEGTSAAECRAGLAANPSALLNDETVSGLIRKDGLVASSRFDRVYQEDLLRHHLYGYRVENETCFELHVSAIACEAFDAVAVPILGSLKVEPRPGVTVETVAVARSLAGRGETLVELSCCAVGSDARRPSRMAMRAIVERRQRGRRAQCVASRGIPQQPNGRGRLRPLATRALLNNATALPASRSRHQEPQMPALSPREFHHGLLGVEPDHWRVHKVIANEYLHNTEPTNPERARKFFRSARELAPDDLPFEDEWSIHEGIGMSWLNQREGAAARAPLKKALELARSTTPTPTMELGESLYNLTVAHALARDRAAACGVASEIVNSIAEEARQAMLRLMRQDPQLAELRAAGCIKGL